VICLYSYEHNVHVVDYVCLVTTLMDSDILMLLSLVMVVNIRNQCRS
jgi:hypothetical protein